MSNPFPAQEILDGVTYFAITIGAGPDGKRWSQTQTYFTEYADDARRIELREIRPVDPHDMAEYWASFRQPFYVVNDASGYVRWMLGGGHALVTKEKTEEYLPWEMGPRTCVCEGSIGFTDSKKLPKTAFQKAPTTKLRMAVLKRDSYRCMLCGQRPADDVNVQLHTHHVRPYSNGGVTTEKNLISLCHTCHAGLEPHYEYSLFDLMEKRCADSDKDLVHRKLREYLSYVKHYRDSFRESGNVGRPNRSTKRVQTAESA